MSCSEVPKLVVGVDFGTTYSGFAFGHRSDPFDAHSFYEWPGQAEAGAIPYCKTQTSLFYFSASASSSSSTYALKHWGWNAFLNKSQDLNGVFATKFKLLLASSSSSAEGTDLPLNLNVETLVTDYLRCLSDFAKAEMRRYGKFLSEDDIQWCITVPALWDDATKKKMKGFAEAAGMKSGYFPLKIVLEPEAASFYCQRILRDQVKFKRGDTFLVADIGGGTIDIIMHEKAYKFGVKVHESSICSGALGGGTFVDENMFSLLEKKIGCLHEYLKSDSSVAGLMKWWSAAKCSFDGSSGFTTTWIIPKTLSILWKAYDQEHGIIREESEYEEIHLNLGDMKAIFDPEVDKVIQLVEDQLAHTQNKIKYMFLVGGFSSNLYLVSRIREAFDKKVKKVFVPPNPGSAICNGAVMLGFDSGLVLSRISKLTYGMEYARVFEVGDPLQYIFLNEEGVLHCSKVFDVFVRKYLTISRGTQAYLPLELYSSEEIDPKYATEANCKLEESFKVDISDGIERGRSRAVCITMYFGRSSIEVSAKRLNFGNEEEEKVFSVEMA